VPVIGPIYDHTVFFGDEHFTVTEPNDMRFPGLFPSALHRRGRRTTSTAVAAAQVDPVLFSLYGATDLRCAAWCDRSYSAHSLAIVAKAQPSQSIRLNA
jgi:hypothetical protein